MHKAGAVPIARRGSGNGRAGLIEAGLMADGPADCRARNRRKLPEAAQNRHWQCQICGNYNSAMNSSTLMFA
jgi:hypothetical protein